MADDKFDLEAMQRAVEVLKANNVPPLVCPKCKREFYWHVPKGAEPPYRFHCGVCGHFWKASPKGGRFPVT